MSKTTETDHKKRLMVETCVWMNRLNLNHGTAGNISIKLENCILITPSGCDYDRLTPEQLVEIPFDNEPKLTSGKPSSEWRFHQALHKIRPDIDTILHAHPVYCSALAVQRRSIPSFHYMVAAFGGHDVPIADYALFGSEQLSNNITRVMLNREGCLMANHGALVVGNSITQAQQRLEELEFLAKTFLLGNIGADPKLLSAQQMSEAVEAFSRYQTHKSN
jgi:L-fuculose-phosphate aldolase